jgi:hypothetical protein
MIPIFLRVPVALNFQKKVLPDFARLVKGFSSESAGTKREKIWI